MAETIVQCRPRPRNRISITLSGGRSFTVPDSEAAEFESGAVLSAEAVDRLERMDHYLRGKEKALRLLSIRSRTRSEIARALEKLGIENAVIEGVVREMIDHGFLDDLRFAREYVRAKVDFKSLGPHRLRSDLKRLGVERRYIDQAVGEMFSEESQEELAREAARRKIGGRTLDLQAVKRVSDFLKRKGFDFEVVNRVTFELLDAAGDQDISRDI